MGSLETTRSAREVRVSIRAGVRATGHRIPQDGHSRREVPAEVLLTVGHDGKRPEVGGLARHDPVLDRSGIHAPRRDAIPLCRREPRDEVRLRAADGEGKMSLRGEQIGDALEVRALHVLEEQDREPPGRLQPFLEGRQLPSRFPRDP
jgi:hypothetical protein